MNYSIYNSLCSHDNFAIFHALKIRLSLRVILSIDCGVFAGAGSGTGFYLPVIFSLSKKSEQSL